MTNKIHPPLVGATLEGPGPFALIGDIHGCFDELAELIGTIRMAYDADVQFISLGDVCDRGPKVSDCFKILRNEKAVIIQGNHDEKLLRYRKGNKVRIGPGQEVSIKSLKDEDYLDIAKMVPFVRLPYFNVVGVHGGFMPGTAIEMQDPKQIIRLRYIDPVEKRMFTLAEGDGDKGSFWAENWVGPEHVYFGHAWAKEIQHFPHATGLDTGCVYGNKLSAVVLSSIDGTDGKWTMKQDTYQIPAKKVYWEDRHGEHGY